MITDLQQYLSNPASGDSVIANGVDVASGQVIDQNVSNGLFSGPGGAEIAPYVFAKVAPAGALAGGTSIQVVVQDAPDNATWTDRILGDVVTTATAVNNYILFTRRLNRSMARYIRVVYRIVGNMTAGTCIAQILLDVDQVDIAMRKAGVTVAEPTGAADESIGNGVLGG